MTIRRLQPSKSSFSQVFHLPQSPITLIPICLSAQLTQYPFVEMARADFFATRTYHGPEPFAQ